MRSHPGKLLLAAIAASTLALTGCAAGDGAADGDITLEVQTAQSVNNPAHIAIAELAESYMADHPGITIDVVPQTQNYEGDMKVRLASGDLPDIWATHGWSLLRYSEFLEPLDSQAWAGSVNPTLDPIMKNDDGQFFALPLTTDITGIIYNADVLESVGVTAADLSTWEDFGAAAEKISAAGITPIGSSGKDDWFAGANADWMSSGAFTDDELASLSDGEFVADGFDLVYEKIDEFARAGYFNADFSSATSDDIAKGLAEGTTAFAMLQNNLVGSALEFNPDAQLGFMPVPSLLGGPAYLIGGEGIALGAARDGAHLEESLAFLDYLAQPENIAAVASAQGTPAGLVDIEVDLGKLSASFDEFFTPGTVPVVPYFDRAYLPNGMWNTLITTTDSVITGQGDPASAVKQVESDFTTLSSQN